MKRIEVILSIELPDHETDATAFATGLFITEHCIEDAEMRTGARVTGSRLTLVNTGDWPTESGDIFPKENS